MASVAVTEIHGISDVRARRAAWAGFQAGEELDGRTRYAVTIAYNPPTNQSGPWVRPARVRLDLDRLHRSVDRVLFGSHYHRFPSIRRTSFRGVIEAPATNIHTHITWSVPDDRAAEFRGVITRAWHRYTRAGSIVVEPIRDDGWSWYATKSGVYHLDDPEMIVFSRATVEK